MIRYLADLAKRYDAQTLRRIPHAKRSALTACFLVEIHKTILDHIVTLHDQLLTKKMREATNAFEQHYRQLRRQYRRGLATLITTGETLLDPDRSPETTLAALRHELGEATLRDAVAICTERQRLEERGEIDALRARYPGLRRYLPAFFALPFQGEPGSDQLLRDSTSSASSMRGPRRPSPAWPPRRLSHASFCRPCTTRTAPSTGGRGNSGWRSPSGMAYARAMSISPRAAAMSPLPTWSMIPRAGPRSGTLAYTELQLPQAPDDFVAQLQRDFDEVAQQAERGFSANAFATIRQDRLHLKRRDALELPPRLKQLRRTIEGALPLVRIEDLLMQVDAWCDFTRAFRRPGERPPRIPHFFTTLLATLIAHGTNLGIATMAHSVEGITADMLQDMSQWCLREDTLNAANAILVNFHHRLPLSAVWGDGTVSSSDGQRFGLQASSLLGSLYPRYFGYYDTGGDGLYPYRGSAQRVSYASHCLFGPRSHLCPGWPVAQPYDPPPHRPFCRPAWLYGPTVWPVPLLGYSLMPRLTVSKQQLYKLDRTAHYGRLDAVLRRTVDIALIREQWDQLVRVAASLRNRTAPAHVVLRRLASSAPSDRLAKALTALGQALRSLYLLRYIHEENLRGRMQLQLNRGEGRHQLARRLFFANQGAFQTGDYEEIMNKATCLSLLSNAVVVWNTVQMTRIIAQLRASGETITAEELARISPLAFAHVIPNGTYFTHHTAQDQDRGSQRVSKPY